MTDAPVRRGRAARQSAPTARQADYRRLANPFRPQEVFSADAVAALHSSALDVLENLGLSILLPEAREVLARAGARVDEDMVFIGRDIVAEALRTAPGAMRMRAPNPAREVDYAPGSLIFTAAGGCPNVFDHERGRHPGSEETFRDAVKLVQSFDVLHKMPVAPEPQDVPLHLRHLVTLQAQLELGDKPLTVYARGRAQLRQCFDVIREALDLSDTDWTDGFWVSTVINSNSPRRLDGPMAQGILDFAREGQMTIITPFCLAGAMAPVTVAGALVLQHAEALAGITLAQMARPGAPVSYGGFSSNVDMKSGSPAFGTPEHMKMQLGAGQLARHIGLPWRSAAGSASNAADAQGAHENIMGLWGAVMGGATLVIHAAGWLEGGLTFGFEKMITDLEALQTVAELCTRPEEDEAARAYEAIAGVPPGGHFFASPHTMERFDKAFYAPLVADLSNHGNWIQAGAQTAETRATAIWQRVLAEFKPPAGAEERAARVAPLIARLTAARGAAPMTES
ncbi:MAG: trimethylamine methyltransferase [Limimaricola sp.]|uniref:trimethylamine methyltransferase family protein n=1 Tax=Limimaricola sp. TaxID=2211665 RepID=UPI001D5D36ED|nr:trimethylamine methyltransferase family protein [Limimaricola sp.]MBI1418433.1 trimethylamine methyltransferase [Limimaricola sp.]